MSTDHKQKHNKRSRGVGRRATGQATRINDGGPKSATTGVDDNLSANTAAPDLNPDFGGDDGSLNAAVSDGLPAETGDSVKSEEKTKESADHAEAQNSQDPQNPEDPLEVAKEEARSNFERFLRAKAELDNVQKRHTRQLSERSKYAVEPLAKDLLAVIDDLKRGLSHATDKDSALSDGVGLVLSNLNAALEKHGVTAIESVGQPFDPNIHEAIAMVPSADVEVGRVVEEHRSGYRLHDRLLRPALVVVASADS